MAFGLFKKKEVIDLSKNHSGSIPTEGYVKRKSSSTQTEQTVKTDTPLTSSSDTNQSTGGFFSFFGNSAPETPVNSNPQQETSVSQFQNNEKIESKMNDLIYRLSRTLDRLELAEKKIERLERRGGLNSTN